MTRLHRLFFTTSGQAEAQGFEAWRRLMAPIYDIRPASRGERQPGGSTIAYLLGDLLVNRTYFTGQHVTRDRKRVDATPDHIFFQLWRSGGYTGQIEGRSITMGAGTVALSDRRRTLDVRFAPADTIGLVVPRSLLHGIDLEKLELRFDPVRNRLLTARITTLYRRLDETHARSIPALRAELLAFLLRILDPSQAHDTLEGPELDEGLFAVARRVIGDRLREPDLSPVVVAEAMGISRSSLYRLFVPVGGVMDYVHERRLLAIRDALADPVERRTVTQLAAALGFAGLPHLSRSFRTRFDWTPRAWRAHNAMLASAHRQAAPEPFWRWFDTLGARHV